MDIYRWLVAAHIACGTLALVMFWSAGVARKGSPMHRRVGKAFLLSMLGVIGTALPMSAVFLARGHSGTATFLAYLVVLTATSCWLSWRAIRLRHRIGAYFDARHRRLAWTNLAAGLCVLLIGALRREPLLLMFCWVGIALGLAMLRDQRRTHPANWWLREHYGAMIGNGVATHIAFLSIGMRSAIDAVGWPWLSLLPWMLPLAIAFAAASWLDRRYGAAKPPPVSAA